MTARGERRLDRLARAVSDGTAVNWDVERSRLADAAPDVAASLERLEQLGNLDRAFRSLDDSAGVQVHPPEAPRRVALRAGEASLFRWGHLDVERHVGEGSFGDVYLALDTRLQREVALKLWRDEAAPGSSPRRFMDEARGLARVNHPNVVTVYGAGVHRGRSGFWTEFVRGHTLAAWLADNGPLDAEEATLIGVDVCRALAAVHAAGLVHGDIKLENVMRAHDGRIVLMDFGAASRVHAAPISGPTRYVTPLAAAPEILEGEPPAPTADIYSLAVLLYRLVSGAYPVVASTWEELRDAHRAGRQTPLRERRAELPGDFAGVVEQGLAHDPGTRFRSARAMETALRTVLHARARSGSDAVQSLRRLLAELGQVPERVCRHAAREIARALVPRHEAGLAHGHLRLESIYLDAHGGVELTRGTEPPARHPQTDLRDLGAILYELATGVSPVEAGDTRLPVGRLNAQLSPFFEELVRDLLAIGSTTPQRLSANDLTNLFAEGERSAWWRERARAIRLTTKKPLRRIRIPRETALHGREHELLRLDAAWVRARKGDGRAMLVTGEAGIGKTRLLDEFVTRLEQSDEDVHFLFGGHAPGGAATPVGAFTSAFRDALGVDQLTEALADYLPDAPILASAFAALLRDEPPPSNVGSIDTRALQTAFVRVAQSMAQERPTIVMIDDLHFATDSGRATFAALVAAVPGHRILLVGSARPDLPADWLGALGRLEQTERLDLSRLSHRDVTTLLSDALGPMQVTDAVSSELAVRSDGNPFFLFEILRTRDTGRELARGIPPSIHQMVAARIASLRSETDRELLDVACCAGFAFDPTLVSAVLHLDEIRVLRRFARMENAQRLVRAVGLEYVFDHHLVQEVLYATLAEPLRRRYHSMLASALRDQAASSNGPRDRGTLVTICAHELRGLDPARALPDLIPAFDHLRERHANAAAIAMADLALGIPELVQGADRVRLLLAKTERLSFTGRRREIQSTLEEAAAIASGTGDRSLMAEIDLFLGLDDRLSGRFDRALSCFERSIAHATAAGDPRLDASARRERAATLFHAGRNNEAYDEYRRSILLAQRAGSPRDEALARAHLGSLLWSGLGRYEEGEAEIRESLVRARELGDHALEASGITSLGVVYLDRGRYEESIPYFERLLAISRETGYRSGQSLALVNLCGVFHALGQYGRALETIDEVLRLSRELTLPDHEAATLVTAGVVWAAIGDLARGRAATERARHLAETHRFGWFGGQISVASGDVEELAGDLEAARRWYARALTESANAGQKVETAIALLALAGVCNRLDQPDEARAHASEALRIAHEHGYDRERLRAELELAFASSGDPSDVLAHHEGEEMRIGQSERARLRLRAFRTTGIVAHLVTARRLVVQLLANMPVACRREARQHVALYGDVQATWREHRSKLV